MGIREFMQKYAEDKQFAAKYQALEDLDEALAQAKEDGYDFSREDALAALQNTKGGELTDDELACVAGGKTDNMSCPKCGCPKFKNLGGKFGAKSWLECPACKNMYLAYLRP